MTPVAPEQAAPRPDTPGEHADGEPPAADGRRWVPAPRVVRPLARHLREPLFRNAYALMLSTVGTGIVGLAFWALAARRYDATIVGQSSALIAAMMTISTFAQLDFAAMLLRFLPRWRQTARHSIWLCYGVASAAGVLTSVGFVLVVGRLDPSLSFLDEVPLAIAFCGSVVAWGIFAIQDGVLTGLGRAPVVPVENTLFGVAKLALLAVLTATGLRWSIYIAWTVPVVVSLLPINLLIFRRYLAVHERRPAHPENLDRRTVVRYISYDYLGSLCGALTTMAMPLVVIGLLGADAAGHFYVAWTLVLMVDTVALGFGSSLLVEGSFEPEQLRHHTRGVLRRGGLLVVPASVAVIVLAPLLLSVFGHEYSEASTTTLRVLAIGVIPRSVIILYTSVARVRAEVRRILGVVVASTSLALLVVVVLAGPLGLTGVAIGWVVGHTLVAACLVPTVLRSARGSSSTAALVAADRGAAPAVADAVEAGVASGPRREHEPVEDQVAVDPVPEVGGR